MAVLLITDPCGARLPTGKQTVDVSPAAFAASAEKIARSGSTPSRSRKRARSAWRRALASHASS